MEEKAFGGSAVPGTDLPVRAARRQAARPLVAAVRLFIGKGGLPPTSAPPRLGGEDLAALAGSETVACLVPGSNYFLNKPYPPGRRLIDTGAAVALATDFNPGTCPCWDMRMIISIACTQMKLSPAEALTAATVNGAWALGLGQMLGSIEPGLQADIVCHDAQDHREIAYYFGAPSVRWVMKKGSLVHGKEAVG